MEQREIPGLEPVMGKEASARPFTIHLQNRIDRDSPFEEKNYRLVEGDFPTVSNEIVINQMLVERNGLRVGDSILEDYRITGMFLSGTERQQTEKVAPENRLENQIYILADESSEGYTKVICYAAEPERLAELAGELEERWGKRAHVRANDRTFKK